MQTDGERIVAIGKGLDRYDCFDTGVFAIGPPCLAALTACTPSLTEGVARLAVQGPALALDCTGIDWIDVDDALALAKAEEWWRTRTDVPEQGQPPDETYRIGVKRSGKRLVRPRRGFVPKLRPLAAQRPSCPSGIFAWVDQTC